VVRCHGIPDYRRGAAHHCHGHVFLFPNTRENERKLIERVERGLASKSDVAVVSARVTWKADVRLQHYGRDLLIPISHGGVAVFPFSHICGTVQSLGPPDFQLLAQTFHTVLIFDVPQLSKVSRNAAKQFIVLVDELYQHRVKLLFTSACPWKELFEGETFGDDEKYYDSEYDERTPFGVESPWGNEEERLSFGRIASRLHEMGSEGYLNSDHNNFVITDFDTSALVT
jgi:predicted ATPase